MVSFPFHSTGRMSLLPLLHRRSGNCWSSPPSTLTLLFGLLHESDISMKSSLISLLFSFALSPVQSSEPLEPYLYLIYHGSDDCGGGFAATVQGFVSGDSFVAQGAAVQLKLSVSSTATRFSAQL